MNGTEFRTALNDFADEGRPVDVGRRALDRLRRRRRRTAVVTSAAAAAAIGLLIPALAVRHAPAPPAGPTPAGHVLAAYTDAGGASHVLDPERGDYRRVDDAVTAVSPDLSLAAGLRDGTDGLRLWPTGGDGPARDIAVPGMSGLPIWAPGGGMLLAPGEDADGSTRVFRITPADGSVSRVDLAHPGRQTVGVWWFDDTTFAVATAPAGEVTDDPTEIRTYALDGTPGPVVAAPTTSFCGDGPTFPPPPVHGGEALLCGRTGADTYLYRVSPAGAPAAVRLSDVPAGAVVPLAWSEPDTAVLLALPDAGAAALHVVDLRSGRVGPGVGLPAGARLPQVAGASALDGAARARAF